MHVSQQAKTPRSRLHQAHTTTLAVVLTSLLLCSTVLSLSVGAGTAHAATMRPASCAYGFEEFTATHYFYPGNSDTMTSCTGKTISLTYQNDGNFVLYINGSPKWATNTENWIQQIPLYAVFQKDGNLVVYADLWMGPSYMWQTTALWASGTEGKGATNLDLQEDGNLVIYKNWSTSASNALWASNTCCY